MRTVIVGASLAGLRAAEALRQAGHEGDILMLGAEPHPPYQRPPLSKDWLLPAQPLPELTLQPAAFFEAQRISLRTSARAEQLDVRRREVILARGERVPFDRLLIATGASPRRLEVPGAELEGVRTLRTVDEATRLRAALQLARDVVVVGAGLIGLEVASAARIAGARVTVIERGVTPLDRLLGGNAIGSAVSELLTDSGVSLHLSRTVAFFEGRGAVRAVVLDDGTRVPADLVIVAAGIAPNTAWLEGSGLAQHDGVLVDPSLRRDARPLRAVRPRQRTGRRRGPRARGRRRHVLRRPRWRDLRLRRTPAAQRTGAARRRGGPPRGPRGPIVRRLLRLARRGPRGVRDEPSQGVPRRAQAGGPRGGGGPLRPSR